MLISLFAFASNVFFLIICMFYQLNSINQSCDSNRQRNGRGSISRDIVYYPYHKQQFDHMCLR